MKKPITLGRVANKIPGNQHIMVRDYLSGVHYADDATCKVIDKVIDYRQDLRNAAVYGISIEGNNILVIDVLIDNE